MSDDAPAVLPDNDRRIGDVVTLARRASMSTSYKPALLKALARIVRRPDANEISLTRIGAEFVKMYWSQTVVFRLRQAATLRKEPEVVRGIREVAERYRVRDLGSLEETARLALERDMTRILKINVLELFHSSKPVRMAPLYTWSHRADSIYLTGSAAAFIAANGGALESLANLWWARYLEKVNVLAPLVIEKVERDGARRTSLSRYLSILRRLDEPRCFYCTRDFDGTAAVHVDHVIPWSFLLSDPLWNLVLACSKCNLAKSDVLPVAHFLDRLADAGIRRARGTLPPGFGSPLIERGEIDRYFQAALSVEWPSGWFPNGFQ